MSLRGRDQRARGGRAGANEDYDGDDDADGTQIKCGGCAQSITQALTPVPGVESVQVDIERKKVTVNYERGAISVEQIKTKLAVAGFPPA